jgi:hypothetical protein
MNPLEGFHCPHCGLVNRGGYTAIGESDFVPDLNQIGICDSCTGVFLMTGPKTADKKQPDDFPDQADELRFLQSLIREARASYERRKRMLSN